MTATPTSDDVLEALVVNESGGPVAGLEITAAVEVTVPRGFRYVPLGSATTDVQGWARIPVARLPDAVRRGAHRSVQVQFTGSNDEVWVFWVMPLVPANVSESGLWESTVEPNMVVDSVVPGFEATERATPLPPTVADTTIVLTARN